jgi:uncharacterized membrane protein
MTDTPLERLETHLGRLLLGGVVISAACLAVGLVIWMVGGHPTLANGMLATGLVLLMATPILRVVVSLVEYVRMRDWFFVTTTVIVFGVLLVTVTLALLHPKA